MGRDRRTAVTEVTVLPAGPAGEWRGGYIFPAQREQVQVEEVQEEEEREEERRDTDLSYDVSRRAGDR